MFGTDPWWLVVIKAVFCFAFLMVTVLFSIVWERKVVAWMQLRIGPNRHGPWGMLQSLADGIKLMLKEDVIVKRADKVVYVLAPIVAAVPAFMAIAVIPFGPSGNEVSIFGHRTAMQLTDLPIAMLYILAVASVGIYGIVLAGWSSGSTYPLLGGLRSCAQMISYEIAMGAAFASVFLYSGSMSTSKIVEAQHDRWFIILLPVSFIIYIVTMVGETNRAPFDMPESEGDLVGGFNTEYSSIKFAMFMLAEYVNMVTVSAVSTTLFLGGWRAPWPISTFWEGANHGWWPMLWFVVKVQLLLFFFIWLRGTLPRVRYDQLMKLGWKILIPVSVVWLMLVATVRALRNDGYDFNSLLLSVAGAVIAILLISFVVDIFRDRSAKGAGAEPAPEPGPAFDPMAGGFPVPPLPGQTLPPVPRRRPRHERELVVSGGRILRVTAVRWAQVRVTERRLTVPESSEPSGEKFQNPVAGFGVTFKAMFKKRLTEQYPEQQKVTAPRFHGRHQLNRHPDGLEKCVGCELCAWACPADAIYVEGADNTDEERYSPGERYGRVYQINYARCILCGLCIEACPTRALTMTNEFELANTTRESLIYTKSELLAGLEEGMVDTPHAIFPGMDEQDYYRGLVTEVAPGTERQVAVSKGEKPSDGDNENNGAAQEVDA